MDIAIIGAGFTGLSSAHELLKKGHKVFVFEKDTLPGGLALGYKEKGWDWSLEKHYHHWFTNDKAILSLAKEINYKVITQRPKTSSLIKRDIYQLDSSASLLKFPLLSISQRIRMGVVLGILRFTPFWRPLEKLNATKILQKLMGKKIYKMIWEPLFINKFGSFADDISLAWFWARIKKRTSFLSYPEGGFLNFAQALTSKVEENGGKIFLNTSVEEIKKEAGRIKISFSNYSNNRIKKNVLYFDRAIVTLPSFLFLKITKGLPKNYIERLNQLKGLGALNMVLRLKKSFLEDGTYWLNVCDKDFPFLSIVEHTNFIDPKYYNNEHIVYIGNYLPGNHPLTKMSKEELLKVYRPYLRRINPNYESFILNSELFFAPFAQPIIPRNYSKIMPPFETPIKGVYLANMQQVYPWDRGTNYAVELGKKIARIIMAE